MLKNQGQSLTLKERSNQVEKTQIQKESRLGARQGLHARRTSREGLHQTQTTVRAHPRTTI